MKVRLGIACQGSGRSESEAAARVGKIALETAFAAVHRGGIFRSCTDLMHPRDKMWTRMDMSNVTLS